MYFYRIENQLGEGPYTCDSFLNWEDKPHHLPPEKDGLGYIHPHELCGFNSVADLRKWFDNDFLNLLTTCTHNNFVVAEYETEKVRQGKHQVVASGRTLSLVNYYELSTLLAGELDELDTV